MAVRKLSRLTTVTTMSPYSTSLLRTMESVAGPWLLELVDRVVSSQGLGDSIDIQRIDRVVAAARAELLAALADLLALEAWEQRRNPLDLVRSATAPLTAELVSCGARPVTRDEFKERSFPGDVLDLAPATWSDVHPDLHEIGLEWGAWKAAAIIAHRRSLEGRPS